MKTVLTSQIPSEGFRSPQASSDYTLRTTGLEYLNILKAGKLSETTRIISKGSRSQNKGTPTSQRWDILTTNQNNYRSIDYPLNKVTSPNVL